MSVEKLFPVANTMCDESMLVPFHDTMDEFYATVSELDCPAKVRRTSGSRHYRPAPISAMVYTLYIGINLTIIMKQYGDRQTDTNI